METPKLYWVALLLLLLAGISGCAGQRQMDNGQQRLSKVSANDLNLPQGMYVLAQQSADLTGDGKLDDVYLVGKKQSAEDRFAGEMKLLVRDGNGRQIASMDMPDVGGYDSKLFVGDFSADGVGDVMVTVPTGGSGGIMQCRIVSFAHDDAKMIFSSDENSGAQFTGDFADGFKAKIRNQETNRVVMLDLNNRRDRYLKVGLYDAAGQLLKNQPIMGVNPFGSLEPVDIDQDGVYELAGRQRITGLYNADTLGYADSVWKYQNGSWKMKSLTISTVMLDFGDQL